MFYSRFNFHFAIIRITALIIIKICRGSRIIMRCNDTTGMVSNHSSVVSLSSKMLGLGVPPPPSRREGV